MNPDDFDLDQSDPDDESLRAAIAALTPEQLTTAIAALPADLRVLAGGVHIEGRTLSDVSQALGMRHAEVVRGLRRARRAILAMSGS